MKLQRISLLLFLMILLLTIVKCDISDCREDGHCDKNEGECCARVIVEDSGGNYIDSHYCLQKSIIEDLGNRYYFKGILGRAYCDQATITSYVSIIAIVVTLITLVGI